MFTQSFSSIFRILRRQKRIRFLILFSTKLINRKRKNQFFKKKNYQYKYTVLINGFQRYFLLRRVVSLLQLATDQQDFNFCIRILIGGVLARSMVIRKYHTSSHFMRVISIRYEIPFRNLLFRLNLYKPKEDLSVTIVHTQSESDYLIPKIINFFSLKIDNYVKPDNRSILRCKLQIYIYYPIYKSIIQFRISCRYFFSDLKFWKAEDHSWKNSWFYHLRWLNSRRPLQMYNHFNVIGTRAPNFTAWSIYYYIDNDPLYNKKGEEPWEFMTLARKGIFRLHDYQNKKNVVLVFGSYVNDFDVHSRYLKFEEYYSVFQELDTEVVFILNEWCMGVRYSVSLQQIYGGFRETRIPIIADPYKFLCTWYGTIGMNYRFAQNAIFVIDKSAVIRYTSFVDFRIGDSISEIIRVLKGINYSTKYPLRVFEPTTSPNADIGKVGTLLPSAIYFIRKYRKKLEKRLKIH